MSLSKADDSEQDEDVQDLQVSTSSSILFPPPSASSSSSGAKPLSSLVEPDEPDEPDDSSCSGSDSDSGSDESSIDSIGSYPEAKTPSNSLVSLHSSLLPTTEEFEHEFEYGTTPTSHPPVTGSGPRTSFGHGFSAARRSGPGLGIEEGRILDSVVEAEEEEEEVDRISIRRSRGTWEEGWSGRSERGLLDSSRTTRTTQPGMDLGIELEDTDDKATRTGLEREHDDDDDKDNDDKILPASPSSYHYYNPYNNQNDETQTSPRNHYQIHLPHPIYNPLQPSPHPRPHPDPLPDPDLPPGILVPPWNRDPWPDNHYTSSTIGDPRDLRRLKLLRDTEQRERDQKRLEDLGYSQVLGRDYGFWASFSVGFCNIGGLQGALFGIFTTFSYGGPKMILVMWPIAGLALTFITLSMGELASAYPVSGAMASWAWTCARKGVGGERKWGWVMGGLVMGYHVGVMCLISWQCGRLINETVHLAVKSYPKENWATTLYSIALMILFGLVGTSKWGRGPRFWVLACMYIIIVWAVVCISLFSSRSPAPASTLLYGAAFRSTSGWSSKPFIYLIGGILSSVATGADACAHLAEETRDPARVVPLAMIASVIASYVTGYVCILSILVAIDPSWIEDIAHHPFPTGQILKRALGLRPTIILLSLCILAFCLQATAQLQASSRFVWALARDQAIPFSKHIHALNKHRLPVAATWLVLFLALPMAFVIWSAPAITASVLSTAAGTFCMISYSVPTLLYLVSNNDLEHEYRSSWSLRRFSKPIGCLTVFSAVIVMISMAFPTESPVTAESFSWSPVATIFALFLSYITWRLYGQSHYSGPIRSITKWTAGAEIDLQSALQKPEISSTGKPHGSRTFPGQTETDVFSPTIVRTVTVAPSDVESTTDSQWPETPIYGRGTV